MRSEPMDLADALRDPAGFVAGMTETVTTHKAAVGHTAGPWRMVRGPVHSQIVAANDSIVAGTVTMMGLPEGKANANLIAAAPAMLAELIDVAASLELHAELLDRWAAESRSGGWSTHQVDAQRQKADTFRRQAAQVRRTIAKATGESR